MMVEPFTLVTGIGNAINLVARTSLNIYAFVKEVRDARKDLTRVNEELSSLRTTLQFIDDDLENADMSLIAQNLEANLSVVVRACTSTVEEIEGLLARYLQHRKTGSIKWSISGKPDADRLRASLESHKASLNLSLDLIDLSLTRAIKQDTTALLDVTRAMQELQTEMHCNQKQILDCVNKLRLKPLEHDAITTRREARQSQALRELEVAVSVAASPTADIPKQESKFPAKLSKTQHPQSPCADKKHPITSTLFNAPTMKVKGDLYHIQLIQSSQYDLNRILSPPEGFSMKNIGQAESACEELLSAISTALHEGLSPKQCFKSSMNSTELPLLGIIIASSWVSQWNESLSKKFLAMGKLCLDHGADLHQSTDGASPFEIFLFDKMSWGKARHDPQSSEAGVPLQSQWMDLLREYGLDITDGPVTQKISRSVRWSSSLVIVTKCISEGLSVDAQVSNDGQTMMHYLCKRMLNPCHELRSDNLNSQGKEELQFLRLLLVKGASLAHKDHGGYTPDKRARALDAEWNKEQYRFKRAPEYEQNLKQFMKLLEPKR